jgi:hypothetical protein
MASAAAALATAIFLVRMQILKKIMKTTKAPNAIRKYTQGGELLML